MVQESEAPLGKRSPAGFEVMLKGGANNLVPGPRCSLWFIPSE